MSALPRASGVARSLSIDEVEMIDTIQRVPAITKRVDASLRADETANEIAQQTSPSRIDRMSASGRCVRERWAASRGLPLDSGRGFSSNPRLLRILRLGHVIEAEVIALLESAGYYIESEQLEVGTAPWVGHIDGIIHHGDPVATRSLLEIKSANNTRYETLSEIGYRRWNETYFAQLQAYMHHLPGINDSIVIVYNKDTSQIYDERIVYDIDFARELEAESKIVTADSKLPPSRPKSATSQFCKYCKWCDRNAWCWSPATNVIFDD